MATFLFLIGGLLALVAFGAFAGAASAVHEILAAVLGLAALVAICAAGVVSALGRLRESIERADRNAWTMGRHVSQVLQHPEKEHGDPGEAPRG